MKSDGRNRVIIENVSPEIDCGVFPVKRVRNEIVSVEADIFSDGHDSIQALLFYRHSDEEGWHSLHMTPLANDRWEAEFRVTELGEYRYTIEAWIDHFVTWQSDIRKKAEAGQDLKVDLSIGAGLLADAATRASGEDAGRLESWSERLRNGQDQQALVDLATSEDVTDLMTEYPDKRYSTTYDRELRVIVNRKRALFSAWYEFFPRSAGQGTEHGSFQDAETLLPDIADMGFDIVYLPPIHPIGRTKRKGKNNAVVSEPGDPGSPWAIGAGEGGHKAVHPHLGTLAEFRHFIETAGENDLDVAMDIAFQCSPDHPWVEEHPEWFRWRPDGSVQYAENPPKKYEDILPINFESDDWENLWQELYNVFAFWIEQGVRIFRVDNPHTKPFPFWEWVIGKLRDNYSDVIFLSEAFTRPKIMYRLAKLGFSQSYTYFTWRNTKGEFQEYMRELYQSQVREFFRPNFWPNTPDILPEILQYGGRPAFIARVVLAATLSSNYGIYGPAYELCVNDAIEGKEEYLDSEKYEIKDWNRNQKGNIKQVISTLNRIRREHPALQQNWNLRFYRVENEHILCYGKATEDLSDLIFVAVNLDPYHARKGKVWLPLNDLNIPADQAYLVHELLSDTKMVWSGEDNYLELDPNESPAKIFSIRRRLRRENDFDYFM